MKKNLIKIVIGILLLLGGWKVAEKGDKVISKEELQKLKTLSENAGNAKGYVRDSFTETTITIKKIKTKLYEYTYDFEVDGQGFTAKSNSNKETTPDSLTIWYNKSNPAENATDDPKVAFEKTSKEKSIGSKAVYYISGIAMIVIGFGLAWGTIKGLLRGLFAKKPTA